MAAGKGACAEMTKEWTVESKPAAIRVRSMASACIPRYIRLQVFESGEVGPRPDYEVQLTRDEAKRLADHLLNAI